LALLAAAAEGIERDKQQLLGRSHLKQQQLDALVTALVGRVSVQSAAAAAGAAIHGSQQQQQQQQTGTNSGHVSPHQDSARRSPSDQLSVPSAGMGRMPAAAAVSAAVAADESLDVSSLQLAVSHEVQQLAEFGLKALRYIPKLTALSSLMQGNW
jgi:hypothetical protein